MNDAPRHRYLRAEDIRRLGSFEFAPRVLAEGWLAGRHRSRERGASIEFRDYREYVPGDDPSLIDWRVHARTDRYYLRTFEQETNLACHVLLDSSASMGYGAPQSKLDYASYFVAALAYLVIRGQDRVSLQVFDENLRHVLPPGSTNRHLDAILAALERNPPRGRTATAAALRRAFPLLARRGTLVVLSDFLDDAAAIFQALNPYLHRGFRVHLFCVLDPREIDLPPRGLTAFVDLETGRRIVAHADEIRAAYRRAMQEHLAALRSMAARRNVDFHVTTTDRHYFSLFDRLSR